MPDATPQPIFRRSYLVILIAIAIIAAIPASRHALGTGAILLASGQLAQFQKHLLSLGPWGPLVSIALLVAEALIVPLPATIILVANGLVFGLWIGALISYAGSLLGSCAAYGIGRYFGRAVLERTLGPERLEPADRIMAKYGSWAIVVERFVPGIPGDPMGYAAGITRIPLWRFVVLTTIGLLPSNFIAAYVGVQIAGDVPLKYWLIGWTIAIAAWLVWRRRSAVRKEAAD